MTALHAPPSVGGYVAHIGGLIRQLPHDDIAPGCLVMVDRDCVGTVIREGQLNWFDVRLQTGLLVVRHVATLSRVVMERGR